MKRPIPAPYDQIDGAFGMLGAVRDAIPIGLVLFLLFVIAGLLS